MTDHTNPLLDDQLVVVAGATGNVGEGITRALLRAGARVAAFSRHADKLDKLRQYLSGEATDRLISVSGDTSTFDGFRVVAERVVAEHGPVRHAVASLGWGWPNKPVWEVTQDELDMFYARNQRLHFAAAQALVPVMADGGSYVLVAGLSAVLPIPGASAVGMQGGAQLMLGTDLQADVGERLRVYNLVLGYILSRSRQEGNPSWLHANDVGDLIVRLATSNLRGQTIHAEDKPKAERAFEGLGVAPSPHESSTRIRPRRPAGHPAD